MEEFKDKKIKEKNKNENDEEDKKNKKSQKYYKIPYLPQNYYCDRCKNPKEKCRCPPGNP
jgi:hypothetical protein